MRRGDWIQTYSGKQFWPLDPRPEEVDILDIAHALAHQCRYGGHCLRFYSVAEHCVLLLRVVPQAAAFAALMHDAAEAYLVDLPRPIKRSMPDYAPAEAAIFDAICERFGGRGHPDVVHEYDLRILTDEMRQNMSTPPAPWATERTPLGVTLEFWSPQRARAEFRDRFHALTEGRFVEGAQHFA